jgi:exodeoxyribonuclease-3
MTFTISTWNINSVRLRIEQVKRFLAEAQPDVLCLQETKSQDEFFPLAAFANAGYPHALIQGMKSYNGVAILSKRPIAAGSTRDWAGKQDCRHAIAEIEGIEIHNFYVPAGGDIPDPEANPKFAHKLQFLSEATEWFATDRKPDRPMILVGDLNIAPLEHDVWSHKQLLGVVSHTPIEVEHLGRLQAACSWHDAVRHFVPETEKLYSWWSYRNRDWDASDRGRRLDHVWITPPLAPRLKSAAVARPVRGWELASDHVPVTVTLEV